MFGGEGEGEGGREAEREDELIKSDVWPTKLIDKKLKIKNENFTHISGFFMHWIALHCLLSMMQNKP